MVQWLCQSPCKPGVVDSIPGFSSPLDGTINRGPLSIFWGWWDVKPKSTNSFFLLLPVYEYGSESSVIGVITLLRDVIVVVLYLD